MIILFSTDWKMAGMKTLIIIFVIMFPVAMITEEDVNHGGNNYDKNLLPPADCHHFISKSCLCFMYRKRLKIFIFTLSLKHHSEDLFTIIFRSSIIHRGLPPKFWMRIVFDFFLGISSHHKRDWRQFAYTKFLGVNKVFYGQCENGEYVNNFYLYIFF